MEIHIIGIVITTIFALFLILEYKKSRHYFKQFVEKQDEVIDNEGQYASLFENNHAVMLLINPETGRVVDANPAACSFYGYSRENIKEKRISDINLLSKEEIFQEMETAKAARRQYFIFKHQLFDGRVKDVEVYSGVIKIKGKKLLYSIVHDLTDKKRAEEKLRSAHSELQQIFDISADGMCVIDKDFNITRANKSFYMVTQRKSKEVYKQKCYEVFKNSYCYTPKCPLLQIVGGSKRVEHEIARCHVNEEKTYFHAVTVPFKDSKGEIIGMLKKIRDITDSKQAEAKINYMAYHDALTSLPNRIQFNIELSNAVKRCEKTKKQAAVVFIDLDGFKKVNDTYGHNFGDLVLQEAAKRFKHSVRKTDIVARFGGDEFLILIQDSSKSEVINMCERILNQFSGPLRIEEKEVRVTPSMGVSRYPKDCLTEEDLIRLADDAMYEAKQAGKNNYQFVVDSKFLYLEVKGEK